ncbi:armadillo-type protein [Plectosphaerella cucumerina]|uniref:Nucleolar protein 9 n=1 Tax=Plectosphaerella cucumerina TaxID=40658 RepID=A0A8K0X300_9PEZI|nr:armadillo-type protein [Plectosphaerella cucumerina]
MGKPRTKRQQLREERKQKRKAQQESNIEAKHDKKRRRTEDDEAEHEGDNGSQEFEEPSAKRHDDGASHPDGPERPEREFFGMLEDDEQEYFRRADELLELNQFPSDEERDFFLQNVYREAAGKELKLASSQSLSRLMERLILLSTARQKKHIFTAFAGHFMSLVQHRFASHCCEALFLQSAPVVTQELGGGGAEAFVVDTKGGEVEGEEPENSMENLFLLTLDELEEHLSFLLTDRFASHTLRVLLVVLSGRPLEDSSTRTLLKSKKKERITVQGHAADSQTQLRAVPGSFTMATKKIIQDAMRDMDFTSLRVLAKHPTGNPLLQLLLELDIALNHKEKSTDPNATLLYKLLPDAPASLANPESEACDLFNSLIYDPIGSRLLETLITHCPGRVFKPLHANILGPRIATYVRNDVASYAALRALNRFSKDDLVPAVEKIIPIMPVLVSKARYNVVKTLYERCTARGAPEQIPAITRALTTALGSNSKELVPKLCGLEDAAAAGKEEKPKFQQDAQNKTAMAAHGAHLVSAMLATPGIPSKVAQNSLLALSSDELFNLATHTAASANVLTTALSNPSPNNAFHKAIVAALVPRTAELALNPYGHRILEAIPALPSRGSGSVPFHVKQTIMNALAAREHDLRESWSGRSTWRAWRGDVHKTRPYDWTSWAKEVDAPAEGGDDAAPVEVKLKPWQKMALKKKEAEAAALKAKESGPEGVDKNETA